VSARATSWLAWSLAALSVAMFLAGAALTVLSLSASTDTQAPSEWGTAGPLSGLLIFLPFLAFPLVGALIASRRPENPIGWICLAAGLFWMFIVVNGSSIPGSAPYPVIIDALFQWLWVPPVGLLGIYLILLFPNGRLPSRRWRHFAWFAGAVMVLASVAVTISPGPLEDHPGVSNLLGLEGHSMVAQALLGAPVLLPICILVSALSLVWRYRHSGGEVRLQIKWAVVGLQAILRILSGQESPLAVVASTLAIAALFNPLRRRVQTFVDRRFYRKKYDARKTLETFSGRLRDETDLDTLSGDLVAVVRETMQPAHVSLRVRPGPSVRMRSQGKDG
jgi:hypothetical protein